MKFSQMPYERPDLEGMKQTLSGLVERLKGAIDQIAVSISSISGSIDGAASGISGAAGSTRVLVDDMEGITGRMDANQEIVGELQKQMDMFANL